jgi:hypothetical protein
MSIMRFYGPSGGLKNRGAPLPSREPETPDWETGREMERGVREPMAPARRSLGDSRGGRRSKRVSTVPAELSNDRVDLGAVQNLFFQ